MAAKSKRVRAYLDKIDRAKVYTADEAFCTTTSYCVLPVGTLNGRPLGKAVPGPVTQRITQAWNRLVGLDIPAQYRQYGARPAAVSAPVS